jgi:hypothetical protein
MCTENHVCFGRIHGSQLREGANAGTRTYVRTIMVLEYLIMLCHNFLIGKGHTCALRTYEWYTCTYTCTMVHGVLEYHGFEIMS